MTRELLSDGKVALYAWLGVAALTLATVAAVYAGAMV